MKEETAIQVFSEMAAAVTKHENPHFSCTFPNATNRLKTTLTGGAIKINTTASCD